MISPRTHVYFLNGLIVALFAVAGFMATQMPAPYGPALAVFVGALGPTMRLLAVSPQDDADGDGLVDAGTDRATHPPAPPAFARPPAVNMPRH